MSQQVSSHLGKNTHTLKQKIMFYVIVNPNYLQKECVYLLDAIQLLQPWNPIGHDGSHFLFCNDSVQNLHCNH